MDPISGCPQEVVNHFLTYLPNNNHISFNCTSNNNSSLEFWSETRIRNELEHFFREITFINNPNITTQINSTDLKAIRHRNFTQFQNQDQDPPIIVQLIQKLVENTLRCSLPCEITEDQFDVLPWVQGINITFSLKIPRGTNPTNFLHKNFTIFRNHLDFRDSVKEITLPNNFGTIETIVDFVGKFPNVEILKIGSIKLPKKDYMQEFDFRTLPSIKEIKTTNPNSDNFKKLRQKCPNLEKVLHP